MEQKSEGSKWVEYFPHIVVSLIGVNILISLTGFAILLFYLDFFNTIENIGILVVIGIIEIILVGLFWNKKKETFRKKETT